MTDATSKMATGGLPHAWHTWGHTLYADPYVNGDDVANLGIDPSGSLGLA